MSKPKKGEVRLTIDVSEETNKKIKRRAVEKDTNAKQYIQELVTKHASKLI